ncbi:MAG: hypothetical protein DI630_11100 [Gordonia sp. (in: high G+C Gram-positive bacteria)]|nr:MAG: hypothetical protein DI630_11100 [Gordonia sp. (in: high G+C Gram-positive bacteria)]
MTDLHVRPTRPPGSHHRLRLLLLLGGVLIVLVALTAVVATLTAPDNGDGATRSPTSPAGPTITDQQARDVATAVTRSMYDIGPATADEQVAVFKANSCGEFAKKTLPDLITSTDQLKTRNSSSTLTIDSMAVVPRPAPSAQVEVIVAFSWEQGDISEKTRAVYQVADEAGRPCITTAQFF